MRCIIFFPKLCLLCAQLHMPASTNHHSTFEVTIPPILGQVQSFSFTFLPASLEPVVSHTVLDNSTINLYLSDSESLHGPTSSIPHPSNSSFKAHEPPTCLSWHLANLCSRHTTADYYQGQFFCFIVRPTPPWHQGLLWQYPNAPWFPTVPITSVTCALSHSPCRPEGHITVQLQV